MQKLIIPANPDGATYIYASQGENKARSYEITIIDISGQPVVLNGTTVVFYVNKRKNIVQIPMKIEGNTATVTLTSGACDVPGDHPCWVQVVKPDTYDLRVDGLVLRVQACNIEGAVDTSDEWGELTQLIVQAQQAIEGANNAAGQAETAAGSANTAADTANSAAGTANTAASNAESAATAANNAASQAAAAASDAQTKGDYAQSQGDTVKAIIEQWEGVGLDDFVPITRTINDKPLSGDITLSPVDIGAQPQTAARNTMVKADASGTLVAAGFDDFAPGIQFENPSGMDYTNVWKFPNGLMIATKTVYLENIAITTATGGFFSSQSQPLGSIPKFVERPYLTASAFGYDNLICWISNLSYKEGDDNKSMLPNIRLASNYSRTGSFYVNVQAIGKWK